MNYPQLPVTKFLWCLLQSILLTDDTTDSDTDSDDSDFSLSREELHDMLRLHRYTRQHQSKFHSDREVDVLINSVLGNIWNTFNICLWNVITVFFPLCVYLSCSFTNISTTALDSCQLMTPSMSNSATYWAQRKKRSKMRRNARVNRKTNKSVVIIMLTQQQKNNWILGIISKIFF